jgi:hypothetical protein
LFARVNELISDLAVNKDGTIKQTAGNIKIIRQVNKEISSLPKNEKYQKIVADVNGSLNDVADSQANYLSTLNEVPIELSTYTQAVIADSFDTVKDNLIGGGFNQNFVNGAVQIVKDGVKSGTDFFEMRDNLQDFIVGSKDTTSGLASYSKQIVKDVLHQTTRTVNATVGTDGTENWYRYVGGKMDTTRPFCDALLKKEWIHKSELGKICRGNIDGKKVSLQGLYPDTNKENIVQNCGGYNCEHQMIAIADSFVPKNIRKKYED